LTADSKEVCKKLTKAPSAIKRSLMDKCFKFNPERLTQSEGLKVAPQVGMPQVKMSQVMIALVRMPLNTMKWLRAVS
jgi:hypothetical protein